MESLKESLDKVSLSDILSVNKIRNLQNDEFLKDNLIYCKTCKTPREAIIKHKDEQYKVNINCKCQQEKYDMQEEKQRVWNNQSKNIKDLDSLSIDVNILTGYSFKSDDMSKPVISKYIVEYVRNFKDNLKNNRGILFSGYVGVGKTFYSRIIANELYKKGYLVLPLRITDLIKIYSSFKDSDKMMKLERMLKIIQ